MMITYLASAVAHPVAVQAVGWSNSATMGLITNVILGSGIPALIAVVLRWTIQLRRASNDRAKQEDDRDGARWSELMQFNNRLQERVGTLENDLRDDRRRCDEEIAMIRREHVSEIRSLNERIEQLTRMFLQSGASAGNLLRVPASTPTSDAKFTK